MNRNAKKQINESGFTLLEVLVSLSVSSLCFLLLAAGVSQTRNMHQHVKEDRQIEWHLFLNQLEYYLEESELYSVNAQSLKVRKLDEDSGMIETASYSFYEGSSTDMPMIRRQTSKGGHQPMLLGLKSFHFSKKEKEIQMEAEFQTGETYRARIWLRNWEESK